MSKIQQKFNKKASKNGQKGYFLERTPLAIQTEKHPKRNHEQYKDLDFWDVQKSAAYRPAITMRWLMQQPLFSYMDKQQVLHFEEKEDRVVVHAFCLKTKRPCSFEARKLILCASVLGTARIVANSVR